MDDTDRTECWRCGHVGLPESADHYGTTIAVCGLCGVELLDVAVEEIEQGGAR